MPLVLTLHLLVAAGNGKDHKVAKVGIDSY